jgi:hypothetical protein
MSIMRGLVVWRSMVGGRGESVSTGGVQ